LNCGFDVNQLDFMDKLIKPVFLAVFGFSFLLAIDICTQAGTNIIFSTSFEKAENYDPDYTLIGQNGWTGIGSGGNGLVSDYFSGKGQQAYIGYYPPEPGETFSSVYKPINFVPVAGSNVTIRFEVQMCIIDSSNNYYDDFRWSFYNTEDHRLFSINFNNYNMHIEYLLDGTNDFKWTGLTYITNGIYRLQVDLKPDLNVWSAFLNDSLLVTNAPITTTGAKVTLGDIDAVWVLADQNHPGNNYMVFDDYTVSVIYPNVDIPPTIKPLGFINRSDFVLRLIGSPYYSYTVEYSLDLKDWKKLKTVVTPADGVVDITDQAITGSNLRFYRARLGP